MVFKKGELPSFCPASNGQGNRSSLVGARPKRCPGRLALLKLHLCWSSVLLVKMTQDSKPKQPPRFLASQKTDQHLKAEAASSSSTPLTGFNDRCLGGKDPWASVTATPGSSQWNPWQNSFTGDHEGAAKRSSRFCSRKKLTVIPLMIPWKFNSKILWNIKISGPRIWKPP